MSDSREVSRRDMLKGSTAAAAGLTLAGGLGFTRVAHAAGSDVVKIALIGCGGRGNGAAFDCLSANDQVKIVAVADAFEGNAMGAADRLNKTFKKEGKADIPS